MKLIRKPYNGCKIEFIYSPFFEMLCSLHVLAGPEHHIGRLKWAKNLRNIMNTRLFKTLDCFFREYNKWLNALDFSGEYDPVNSFSIIEALEFLEALDINKFSYTMLGKKLSLEAIKDIIRSGKITPYERSLSSEYKLFLTNPHRIREKFICCLKEYYYCHFQNELKYLEPLLVRSLKKHKFLSEKLNFLEYIASLHNRIEIKNNIIHFHKHTRLDVSLKELKIIRINISSFIHPHLLIGINNENKSLNLIIRINLNNEDKNEYEVPTDLHGVIKSLGDKTRLKILKSIYQKPECTQELAKILGLTEACISKHLKILYSSNLVKKQRKGNFIFYKINCTHIDKISYDIYQFFDS